ncbi:MAG: type II toxin-antitoxin system VapC family toxin [Nitrospirota bacterium]
MPVSLVIDANVVTKLYIPEVLADRAEKLFIRVEKGETSFVVPDLIYAEIGNVLWKKHRLKELTTTEIQEILNQVLTIPFIVIAAKSLFELSIDLSVAYDMTVYDALYVSAATIYKTKLVTADKKIVEKLNNTALRKNIVWLGDIKSY